VGKIAKGDFAHPALATLIRPTLAHLSSTIFSPRSIADTTAGQSFGSRSNNA
jgi:hypothetical protein